MCKGHYLCKDKLTCLHNSYDHLQKQVTIQGNGSSHLQNHPVSLQMQNQRNCALEYMQTNTKFYHKFNSLVITSLIMLWMVSFYLQSWI